MTDSDIRYCRVCGAAFKKSPADSTVNCPDHRKRASSPSKRDAQAAADHAYIKMGEARARGRAARAAGDVATYDAAVGDFAYWADRRREALKDA